VTEEINLKSHTPHNSKRHAFPHTLYANAGLGSFFGNDRHSGTINRISHKAETLIGFAQQSEPLPKPA
jgi:hypothetical protein